MENNRPISICRKSPIIGLTLLLCAILMDAGRAQAQHTLSPHESGPSEVKPGSIQLGLTRSSQPNEPEIYIELTEVLTAAQLNFDAHLSRSLTQSALADVVAADHAPIPVLSSKASQMDLQNGLGPGSVLNDKRIDKSIGIDWTWERGDKRSLRTQSTKNLLSASQFDLSDTITGQQILAYNAFIDLYAAQLKEDEFFAIAQSYQKTNETASIRLKNGDLSAQDAYRISIENQRAQADAQAAKLERQNSALVLSQLAKLQGSPLRWRVRSGFIALKSSTIDTLKLNEMDHLIESATQLRADVIAAAERVKAAKSALDLALSFKKSDLTWGASIDHYPGTSNRLMELRVQLPLQINYGFEGEIKRAQEQLNQAQLSAEKTKLLAATELQSLLQKVLISGDRSQRYESIILPQAKKVLEQAEFAYSKGALSLTDLLDARRTFRSTRIEAISSQAELSKSHGAWFLRTQPYQIEPLVRSN